MMILIASCGLLPQETKIIKTTGCEYIKPIYFSEISIKALRLIQVGNQGLKLTPGWVEFYNNLDAEQKAQVDIFVESHFEVRADRLAIANHNNMYENVCSKEVNTDE